MSSPVRIPDGFVDELKARIRPSDVIGRKVKLTKKGKEWVWLSPFTAEKTPSFYVNDQKRIFKCFSSGMGGDVISFVMETERLSFMEAVEKLAEEAGMELPKSDPRAAEAYDHRKRLQEVCEAAASYFEERLQSSEGAAAREYLEGRGLKPAAWKRHRLGYAPDDWRKTSAHLKAEGFTAAEILEAGLTKESDKGGEPYDAFRGRLMFPIPDSRGGIIAFGGRGLTPDAKPKYLNSGDTPLFHKSRVLYRYKAAREALGHGEGGGLIVCEGYMDAIALANAGIREAVAPLGTALTENQIELLWRQVEQPILCFDGDNAGQRAAMRAVARALPMLRPAHSLSIVRMPAGLDPDDLIREKGVTALEELLGQPSSLLDTLWDFEKAASPLNSPEDKAGFKARLLDHVENIQHPDIRALYKRELLERFSNFAFPPRPPREFKPRGEWKKRGFRAPAPTLTDEARDRLTRAMQGGGRDALTRAVIAGLVRFPDQILPHEDALAELARRDQNVGPAIDSLFEAAETLDLSAQSTISLERGLPAPPAKTLFAFLDEGIDPGDAREDLAEAVSLLVERPALESALAEATARFERDPEGSIAEQARLRERLLALNERLKRFGRRKAAADGESDS